MRSECRAGVSAAMVVVAVLALGAPTTPVSASQTKDIGGPAGTHNFSNLCSNNDRVTGIRVKHADVIDKIAFRCTPITANGTWGSPHKWTAYTASGNPKPATATATAECSSNRFVGGFNGYVKKVFSGQSVLAQIQIACYASDATKRAAGSAQTRTAGTTSGGGGWGGWANCPKTGLAIGGVGRRGWYLDKLALDCVDPVAGPAAAPALVFPKWNATAVGDDYASPGEWAVRLQPVSGATRYQICLRDAGAASCFTTVQRAASQGYAAGGTLQFGVTIPTNKQGQVVEWNARGCNDANACGPWAANYERFTVVPGAPNLSAPANNATATSRSVAFSWSANPAANAGYQLIVWRSPGTSGYNTYNPTTPGAVTGQMVNIQLNAGVTNYTLNIPADLGNAVRWEVRSCANFTGKGRRCGFSGANRTLALAPSFSFAQQLAPTFQHARCVNCHAVAAGNFTVGVGLPGNHPGVSASTNCAACHSNGLLPTAGSINPGWHAPPSNMDFRNKTPSQLCTMARNAGSAAPSPLSHLTQDKLILWAVGDGRLPQGVTRPTAPPNSISTWQTRIQAWVNAGMPCD